MKRLFEQKKKKKNDKQKKSGLSFETGIEKKQTNVQDHENDKFSGGKGKQNVLNGSNDQGDDGKGKEKGQMLIHENKYTKNWKK